MLLIIDNSSLVAERLIDLLTEQRNIGAIAKVANGSEANAILKQVIPDIILLDMRLPDINSLELLTELRVKYPSIRFIVTSDESNDVYRDICEKKGAAFFVNKADEFQKIPGLIKKIRKRELEAC